MLLPDVVKKCLMEAMNSSIFFSYRELLARLDSFARQLAARHGASIVCGPGCAGCCRQILELLPVEFYYLQAAARRVSLPKPAPAADVCPLLEGGLCRLYAYRPVICRTHGMPLLMEGDGGQWVDCCPENFTSARLADLAGDSLLHLERVNLLLVSINHVFAAARGLDAGQRLSIEHIFQGLQH